MEKIYCEWNAKFSKELEMAWVGEEIEALGDEIVEERRTGKLSFPKKLSHIV